MNGLQIAMEEKDMRSKHFGWAPGNYFCTCYNCEKLFIGDKRAVECSDCAYMGTYIPQKRQEIKGD
jgi:hypothetical protein